METGETTLLWQRVEHWAKIKPDAEAIVFGDRRITWGEFNEQMNRAAKAFLELGVQRGDRIALVAMGCPEFIISFMAASKIGAIWLGLSPKFTVDELRYVIGHSRPTVLITLREYLGVDLVEAGLTFGMEYPCIKGLLVIGDGGEDAEFESYETFMDQPRPELDDALAQRAGEVKSDDEVLLMYTSGSTGKPKGVLHTHGNIIRNIAVEVEYFGFSEDSRALLHFPINHVAADVELGYASVYGGATLVLMDRFDPQATLEMIEREKVNVLGQVPVMYLMEFQTPKFPEMDWSSMKAFVWGGTGASPIMMDVLWNLSQMTGARLITGYGSTELCGFVTYTKPEDSRDVLFQSAGRIVPPYEMRIVDDDRKEVPLGTIGEIAFRGPVVMKGYMNNPTATAEVLDADGWYYTGDLGRMDEEGYLYISGRATEMFKSGGENVYPREVEEMIENHPAALFAAVIGVPDELYDEVGHAFVMLKPGATASDEELRAYCKERLANFKVPKHFSVRPELPLLPTGKVSKVALRKEIGL